MISKFFCAYHAQRMRSDEQEAYRCWNQMMHRGAKAYAECRIEAANIYLGSALEVALIRAQSKSQKIFSEMHISKPVAFLVELFVAQDKFDICNVLLKRVSEHAEQQYGESKSFQSAISELYVRIESAEKAFFGGGALKTASLH